MFFSFFVTVAPVITTSESLFNWYLNVEMLTRLASL